MPKRTNDFQQIVHMIQKAFAPVGAKITESAMVPSRGTMREIDILIETDNGPYRIKAVEAKNEKRPLDVTDIDALVGKYFSPGGIKVDKLAVVSQSGFYSTAYTCAQEVGNIELFTLSKVTPSDWTKLAPQCICFQFAPHVERVELIPEVPNQDNKDPSTEGYFVCEHGQNKGTPRHVANWILRTQVLASAELMRGLEAQARKGNGSAFLTVPWPLIPANPPYSDTLIFEQHSYKLKELRVIVHYVNASDGVKWSSHTYSGSDTSRTVDQMEAVVGGSRVRTLFPDGPNSNNLIVRFDKAAPNQPTGEPEPIWFKVLPAPYCPTHLPPIPSVKPRQSSFSQPVRPSKPPEGAGKKTGRNAPCPCGSGKKFKHCHLKRPSG
jgi:hypothetical protein